MTFVATWLWNWVRKLRRDVDQAFKKIRSIETEMQRWEDS